MRLKKFLKTKLKMKNITQNRLDIVEKILEFNNQCQTGKGIKILTLNDLAQLQAGKNS